MITGINIVYSLILSIFVSSKHSLSFPREDRLKLAKGLYFIYTLLFSILLAFLHATWVSPSAGFAIVGRSNFQWLPARTDGLDGLHELRIWETQQTTDHTPGRSTTTAAIVSAAAAAAAASSIATAATATTTTTARTTAPTTAFIHGSHGSQGNHDDERSQFSPHLLNSQTTDNGDNNDNDVGNTGHDSGRKLRIASQDPSRSYTDFNETPTRTPIPTLTPTPNSRPILTPTSSSMSSISTSIAAKLSFESEKAFTSNIKNEAMNVVAFSHENTQIHITQQHRNNILLPSQHQRGRLTHITKGMLDDDNHAIDEAQYNNNKMNQNNNVSSIHNNSKQNNIINVNYSRYRYDISDNYADNGDDAYFNGKSQQSDFFESIWKPLNSLVDYFLSKNKPTYSLSDTLQTASQTARQTSRQTARQHYIDGRSDLIDILNRRKRSLRSDSLSLIPAEYGMVVVCTPTHYYTIVTLIYFIKLFYHFSYSR